MHKFLIFLSGVCLMTVLLIPPSDAQSPRSQQPTDNSEKNSPLAEAGKWFAAWEMISRDFYKIDSLKPVEFVFFDDKYVYSTADVSAPNGVLIEGPSLFGKKLIWKRAAHDGKIKLPDGKVVPVGLMSFAAPLENRNAFFVMPLPEFWRQAGVTSKELGLENLVTGVFLHEFSHSQQMQNFGKRMSAFERAYKFDTDFNDDIVQDYFEKNVQYDSLFREETELFYDAAAETDKAKSNDLLARALGKYNLRHDQYFTGDKKHFREIDELFLTMEGFGQFSMYLWLTSPKGGGTSPAAALPGVRRGGKYWSQEEGLALFLVLNKFSKPQSWAKLMTGNRIVSVIELINKNRRVA